MTDHATRPQQWLGSTKAWLATVLVAVAFAPVTALAAGATALVSGFVLGPLDWQAVVARAVVLGAMTPIALAIVGIPVAFAAAPRLGLRFLGGPETAAAPVSRHLHHAASRAARRQGLDVDIRLTQAHLAEPVVVPDPAVVGQARPRQILATPARLAALDPDRLDEVITPVLCRARRRPIESRARLALLAPNLIVQGFWRTIRWEPVWRIPLLGAVATIAVVAAPAGSVSLRLLAGLVLALATCASLAAVWTLRLVWARCARVAADMAMRDPVAGITLPSWVIDLRDDPTDTVIDVRSTEVTA